MTVYLLHLISFSSFSQLAGGEQTSIFGHGYTLLHRNHSESVNTDVLGPGRPECSYYYLAP